MRKASLISLAAVLLMFAGRGAAHAGIASVAAGTPESGIHSIAIYEGPGETLAAAIVDGHAVSISGNTAVLPFVAVSGTLVIPERPAVVSTGIGTTTVAASDSLFFAPGEGSTTLVTLTSNPNDTDSDVESITVGNITASVGITQNGAATYTVAAVPEPSSLALAGLGAFGLIGYAWRRRRHAVA